MSTLEYQNKLPVRINPSARKIYSGIQCRHSRCNFLWILVIRRFAWTNSSIWLLKFREVHASDKSAHAPNRETLPLCGATSHRRVVFTAKFWTFYGVIFMVYESVDHWKMSSIWFLQQHTTWENTSGIGWHTRAVLWSQSFRLASWMLILWHLYPEELNGPISIY